MGMLGLLIVTIIWGGGFVASDMALETLFPFQIMTGRFFLAAVLMLPLSLKNLKGITKEEFRAGISLGFFLFAGFALQIIALQHTTPSKNAFLTATNVVFVPFIALVVYKKKVSIQGIAGALMAIIGAGVLSFEEDFILGIGDSLTLICAVCFAFQIFLTGEYVGRYRATVLNFLQMATAFLCSCIGLLITGVPHIEVTQKGILSILYLGVVSTTITYLLQTISQKYVDETKTAIILSLEAVFGSVFSILILHEEITVRMAVGSILIMGAVLVSEIKLKEMQCFKGIKLRKL